MKTYIVDNRDEQLIVTSITVDSPQMSSNQLLIKVHAASLNRGELLSTKRHGAGPKRFGAEVAGEVIAVGDNVRGWQVGDRVMGRSNGGGFAEEALIDHWEAMAVPPNVGLHAAAAIPLVYTVAWDMLSWPASIAKDDVVLVAGVSSGVGTASMLLAKAMGAKVIGSSRAIEKLEELRALGLDASITSGSESLSEKVLEYTQGHGVKVAINVVGGDVFGECLKSLAVSGALAIVGHMDGIKTSQIDLPLLHERRLSIFGVSNKLRTEIERAELVAGVRDNVLPYFANGKIVPIVPHIYPNSELQQAVNLMERNAHTGKIVVTW